jgi:dipeptidyl aminopeptidase/acylaminoacyl peptidase
VNLINFEFILTFILPQLIYATVLSAVIAAIVGGIVGLITGAIARRLKHTIIPAMVGAFLGTMLVAMTPVYASPDTYIGGPFGGLAILLKMMVLVPAGSIIGGVLGAAYEQKLTFPVKRRITWMGLLFTYTLMVILLYFNLAPAAFQFVKSSGQEPNFLPYIGKIIGYEQKFSGYNRRISSLAFTHDGQKLVIANIGDIRVWQLDTGKLLHTFPGSPHGSTTLNDQIIAIAITPDNQTLVTAAPQQIQLRELESGKILHRLEGSDYIKLTPDAKTLIGFKKADNPTADVGVWELSSRKLLRTIPANLETLGSGYPVDITGDGKTLVIANSSYSNQIEIRDMNTGKRLQSFGDNQGKRISTLVITPDGKNLITAQNNNLQIWDMNTKKIVKTIPNVGTVNHLLVTPDSQTLISSGDSLHIWEITTGKKLLTWQRPPKVYTTEVALSPDGKILAATDDRGVRLWRLALAR